MIYGAERWKGDKGNAFVTFNSHYLREAYSRNDVISLRHEKKRISIKVFKQRPKKGPKISNNDDVSLPLSLPAHANELKAPRDISSK